MRTPLGLALGSLLAPGCLVTTNERPILKAGASALGQHNFRGQVFSDKPVAKVESNVSLPAVNDGTLRFDLLGFVELKEDNGDAWLPDGHAGKFSEMELQLGYGRQVGDYAVFGGVTSYILPNGLEFPNGERGETVELFVAVTTQVDEYTPQVVLHYDIDEVEDYYATAGVSRTLSLKDDLRLRLEGQLGFSGDDASLWTYGLFESGISDMRLSAELLYKYNSYTFMNLGVTHSRIMDGDLRDWFDVITIEQDNTWLSGGVSFLFGG